LKWPHFLLVMFCIVAYIPSIYAVGTDATAAVGINLVSASIVTYPICAHQDKKQRRGSYTAHTSAHGITQQDLDSQQFIGVPNDWDTNDQYHPVCVTIWRAYLEYQKVYLNLCPIEGSRFHEVHPDLPWNLSRDEPVVFLLMNYLTSNLANGLSNGLHPSSARRTDGTLRSCCWELIRLSLTEDLYNRCEKTNVIPFAYPYNGDSSDVFSDKDVVTIMNAYTKFLRVVFREVSGSVRQSDIFAWWEEGISYVCKKKSQHLLLCPSA
jgi:hypothetical protein